MYEDRGEKAAAGSGDPPGSRRAVRLGDSGCHGAVWGACPAAACTARLDLSGGVGHIVRLDGHFPLLQALIGKNADLNVRDKKGATPLVLALGEPAMRDFLIESGVDLEAQVMDRGMKILHFAIENFGDGEPACYLIEKGADPDSTDMFGDTPLHYAARERNLVVVKALIGKKADVNRQNKKGETPVFLAAGRGDAEIVKLLLDNGARADVKTKKGESLLDYASGSARKMIENLPEFQN